MSYITIQGVPAYAFGANNYSNGLNPVTFHPKDVSVQEIKEMKGVFLNPFSSPNSLEIFALVGTDEQYHSWYKMGLASWASKKAINQVGKGIPAFDDRESWELIHAYELVYKHEFKPWWEKD